MCSVQIFKFLAKIYIINLIFSQEYIFIAFSQESAFSFSQVSNMHLAKIYTTRIRVPPDTPYPRPKFSNASKDTRLLHRKRGTISVRGCKIFDLLLALQNLSHS